MRLFVFFAILILGFFAAITAAVRPDIIEQKYSAVSSPIIQHFADRRAVSWKEAKQTEKAIWMLQLRQAADCSSPKTAIREMECRNRRDLHAQAFEQEWANKVRNGWRPAGIEE